MKKILVLRFSAMGDVALLVPVLASLIDAHADVEVTVATRPAFAPLFLGLDRVKVFPADVDSRYSGFFGIRTLFRDLIARGRFSLVIDAHDHIRTVALRSFFKIFGTPVYVFKKGRAEKKAFARRHNKVTSPLPHAVDRYVEVFNRAGFSFPIKKAPYVRSSNAARQSVARWLAGLRLPYVIGANTNAELWIGLAPFAAHATKIWPIENYPLLMEGLTKQANPRFFLFGGGKTETDFFDKLIERFPERAHCVAGHLGLDEELVLMNFLNLIVTVDSANMHLASLMRIPILSIWGGTHPDVGFGPFGYGADAIVQVDPSKLTCRPCSIYGKATCFRGDFACLTEIRPETVVEKIIALTK